MKVTEMSPKVTPWKDGLWIESGNWTVEDTTICHGEQIRRVMFGRTPVVEYGDCFSAGAEWTIIPLSVADGSPEVQMVVNLLLSEGGSPCLMGVENGKAVVRNIHNWNEIALPY